MAREREVGRVAMGSKSRRVDHRAAGLRARPDPGVAERADRRVARGSVQPGAVPADDPVLELAADEPRGRRAARVGGELDGAAGLQVGLDLGRESHRRPPPAARPRVALALCRGRCSSKVRVQTYAIAALQLTK